MAIQKRSRQNRPRDEERTRNKQLNIRLDEQMKFALSFAAKQKGITMATWLDQQLQDFIKGTGWEAYWHPSEPVREVLRLRYGRKQGIRDEEIALFLQDFGDLMFRDTAPKVQVLEAVWPDLGVYLKAWKKDPMEARALLEKAIAKLPKSVR